MRLTKRIGLLLIIVCGAMLGFLSSCSPFYVARAGWEEARILWVREPIQSLIERPDTDDTLRSKFRLVLQAREYASTLGLLPEDSFTQYSDVGREVLLWVLSGSNKLALQPVTWWFPIVGRVPYKGFFDRDDAEIEAKRLEKRNFDVYLRPSSAFSTLGWFNDPLLSTTAKFDELALVNTVIHEVLHNTVWIKNHVAFNETLANFVGSIGSRDFFRSIEGADSKRAADAEKRWELDLEFGRFLDETILALEPLYKLYAEAPLESEAPEYAERLQKRLEILDGAVERWRARHPDGEAGKKRRSNLNNATIISYQIYLTKPWLFADLYAASGSSLTSFIQELKILERKVNNEKADPYVLLSQHIEHLKVHAKEAASTAIDKPDSPLLREATP